MKISILGPGSWGLTVAWILSNKNYDLTIWGLPNFIEPIKQNRNVDKPVKLDIPDNINLTSNIQEAACADIILCIVPSDAVRDVSKQLSNVGISKNSVVVNFAKGLELNTLYRMSEVISQELPNNEICTLSGPTLAMEILSGKPTAAVVASNNMEVASFVQKTLNREDLFRLYTNNDIVGVEIGGSLKNVIAIATGFSYALDLGHNAIGAIITRGLAEIVRISLKLGANPSTLYGLSGMGDLIATCNSPTSRNFKVGYQLAQGQSLDKILNTLGSVAEGVKTTEAACALSMKYDIEMPISSEVASLLSGKSTPECAIKNIMRRQLKSEDLYTLSAL